MLLVKALLVTAASSALLLGSGKISPVHGMMHYKTGTPITVYVQGQEQTFDPCQPHGTCPLPDQGAITINANCGGNATGGYATYDASSDPGILASELINYINSHSTYVLATANGTNGITLTDTSLTCTFTTGGSGVYQNQGASPSFTISPGSGSF